LPIADIVHQHHERIDGSGYPLGLKGDDILMEARVVAVADVVEAMVSARPHRPALSVAAVMNEIKAGKGTLYDPNAVDACVRLFDEGKFHFDREETATPEATPSAA
jgi:HD-GYP domain-containing protein (c-di-GMP phosphodiesterase class II)